MKKVLPQISFMPELAISDWRSYAVKLAKCPPPSIMKKKNNCQKKTSMGEISAELTFLFKKLAEMEISREGN